MFSFSCRNFKEKILFVIAARQRVVFAMKEQYVFNKTWNFLCCFVASEKFFEIALFILSRVLVFMQKFQGNDSLFKSCKAESGFRDEGAIRF